MGLNTLDAVQVKIVVKSRGQHIVHRDYTRAQTNRRKKKTLKGTFLVSCTECRHCFVKTILFHFHVQWGLSILMHFKYSFIRRENTTNWCRLQKILFSILSICYIIKCHECL